MKKKNLILSYIKIKLHCKLTAETIYHSKQPANAHSCFNIFKHRFAFISYFQKLLSQDSVRVWNKASPCKNAYSDRDHLHILWPLTQADHLLQQLPQKKNYEDYHYC